MIKNPFVKKVIPVEGQQWIPLLKKNGYTDATITTAASKIEKMDPQLQEALVRWDRIGALPDRVIEGFTVAGLMENAGMHPIGAFLMMDWLLREPDEAKYALAQPVDKLEISQEIVNKIEESEVSDYPEEAELSLEKE